jgi:2-iminobutanoate/2-iminopropanoate deaminase
MSGPFQEALSQMAKATAIGKQAITNPRVLNEAHAYGSSFSRGLRVDVGNVAILLISGTASIDEDGNTVHPGDFRAQCRRT